MTFEKPHDDTTTASMRKRQQIIDGATALFAKKPRATLAEVADAARVGRATIYRYFPNRHALMRELATASMKEMNAAIDALGITLTFRQYFEEMFTVILPMGAKYHFLANESELMEDDEIAAMYAEQNAGMRVLVEQAQAAGELDPKQPTLLLVRFIDGLIWSIWSAIGAGELAPLEAAERATKLLFDGAGIESQ